MSLAFCGPKPRLRLPDLLAQFSKAYRKAFYEVAARATHECLKAGAFLKKVDGKITGILKAIEKGMYHASLKAKMSELEAEKAGLEAIIKESPEPPALRLNPSLRQRYREMVEDLARSLNAPEVKREAMAELRALISQVRMVPDAEAPSGHLLELIGGLAGILALVWLESKKPPLLARALS